MNKRLRDRGQTHGLQPSDAITQKPLSFKYLRHCPAGVAGFFRSSLDNPLASPILPAAQQERTCSADWQEHSQLSAHQETDKTTPL